MKKLEDYVIIRKIESKFNMVFKFVYVLSNKVQPNAATSCFAASSFFPILIIGGTPL